MGKTDKKLLLDLYRVATVDGDLSPEEQIILNNVCIKNGIHIDELMYVLKKSDEEDILPETEGEKFKYLFEIARLIISDGIIRDEELYLFDKIADSLQINRIIKKNIFRAVIDEFLKSKEQKLKKLRKDLNIAYESKINIQTEKYISMEDHKKIVEELINGYKNGTFGTGPVRVPRIVILGEFAVKEDEIISIIKNTFQKSDIILDNKTFRTSIGYEKVKSGFASIQESINNGELDYFIFGPHPHSLKNKKSTDSWEKFFEKLDIIVKGNYSTPPSRKEIKNYATSFAEHWKENYG